jgi:hypothetical protein
MTTDDDFDRQIQAYLESGPAELADRVLWSARAKITTTRRRSARFGWLTARTKLHVSQSTRLLLAGGGALVLVVAIGAGMFGSIFGRGDTGQGLSSSPSMSSSTGSPTPALTPAIPVYPGQSASPLSAAWETAGGAATKFGVPEVGLDGRVWAASSVDNAFRILTPEGTLTETWGSPGTGDGEFDFTVGSHSAGAIAFAPDGGFWVLDSGNFRVQRFARDRTFLSSWGRYGSGDGEFVDPVDISVDQAGSIFVGDDARHVIQVFTSDGRYLRSVAVGAAGPFVSGNGDGWVDTNRLPDGRPGIVEYKPDGTIQGGIDMPDLIPVPMGMTRDDARNLYVVGLTQAGVTSRLVRFNKSGQKLDVWDAGGVGVAVSSTGDVAYVLQASLETIRKYVIPAP